MDGGWDGLGWVVGVDTSVIVAPGAWLGFTYIFLTGHRFVLDFAHEMHFATGPCY